MQHAPARPFPSPPRTAEAPFTAVFRPGAQRLLAPALALAVALL